MSLGVLNPGIQPGYSTMGVLMCIQELLLFAPSASGILYVYNADVYSERK